MDAEILCSAFHRYARPEIPEDSRFGAGFSLPVVQAIMQAHGGSILLQSQRGGGTDALKLDDALAAVDDFVAEHLK